ncbi:glucose 1-dehydrogenase [Pseudoalteromonas rubra]|uniref:Glucose 1-dehydrogenase n=1 Tax=Pseudoalteromonas rubra TaxID=43658 RepID=A0A8T0C8B0_9GAMM|nr:SDR family oxidoreductase [Pseudoalteromonas rubra]KAF7786291.1 glucose 1-dehydrogenase [Pseudoalteromonas rubra]
MNAKKTAIVTGSSRGIGKTIAIELAKVGYDIIVVYFSNQDAAKEVQSIIQDNGQQCHIVQADVTDPLSASNLVKEAINQFKHIDLLVNNVGDFFFKPIEEMTISEWDHVLKSNLSSAFYLCHSIIPFMKERKAGNIINIGLSTNNLVRASANVSAYSIAKTGIAILTSSMAEELAEYGIRVNCVSPGLIDNGHLPESQKTWMIERVPMKRLGRSEDIADAIIYLASDKSAYVSGSNLAVSGAWDWNGRPNVNDEQVHDLFVEPA